MPGLERGNGAADGSVGQQREGRFSTSLCLCRRSSSNFSNNLTKPSWTTTRCVRTKGGVSAHESLGPGRRDLPRLGLGLATEISESALGMLLAFLRGDLILNVLKEELPDEREIRF